MCGTRGAVGSVVPSHAVVGCGTRGAVGSAPPSHPRVPRLAAVMSGDVTSSETLALWLGWVLLLVLFRMGLTLTRPAALRGEGWVAHVACVDPVFSVSCYLSTAKVGNRGRARC